MLFDYIPLLLATVAGTVVGATAACSQDNCLRAVIASAVPTRSGSADCASYFRTTFTPPTVTMSVTKTKVIKTTISETVLISTTDTGTIIIVQSSTTAVSGGTLTIVPTPNSEGGGAKRDVRGRKAPAPAEKRQATKVPTKIPAYASACTGAVRYSSACSCVGAKHTTITAAAPTKKVTVTITNTATLTFLTSTTAVSSETTTITTTQMVTSTSYTSVLATPTCTTVSVDNGGHTYLVQYVGFLTLNPNNSGNIAFAPLTSTYPDTDSICAAVNACASFSGASNYYTFNLQYVDATQSWYCVSYFEQARPGDYNADTPGVSQSYGFVVDLSLY